MNSYGNGGLANYNAGSLGPMPNQAIQPPTPNSVGGELSGHEAQIKELHAALDELGNRLQPILGASAPNGPSAEGATVASASQLITILRAQGFQLDGAIQRIRDFARRAEV